MERLDGIYSGDAFGRVISTAIIGSKIVVFFASQTSNVSEWTLDEIFFALIHGKPVIPVRLDKSNYKYEVELRLCRFDYIDYSCITDRPLAMEKLVRSLRNKIGGGNRPVQFSQDDYVDLGLPSGTKWKSVNETGGTNGVYTFREALAAFGNRLPTKERFVELLNSCTWTGSGYKVTGLNSDLITLLRRATAAATMNRWIAWASIGLLRPTVWRARGTWCSLHPTATQLTIPLNAVCPCGWFKVNEKLSVSLHPQIIRFCLTDFSRSGVWAR